MASVMQTVMSGKRQFGVPGLNKPSDGRKKHRQDVAVDLSIGRHNPVFPQSIITQGCIVSLPPSCGEPNPDPDSVMAPRGNFDKMYPKRGEWACRMLPADARGANSATVGGYGDIVVFTCGNDVPIHYPLMFAGIMTNAADLGDENRDEGAAMDIGGTVTGINYGAEKICAGDMVWLGLPLMITDGGSKRIPAIVGAGCPPDKAFFSTNRLKWNNVCSATADVRDFLEKEYKASMDASFLEKSNLANILDLSNGVRMEMPLYYYGCIYAHELHLRMNKDNADKEPSRIVSLNAFLVLLKELENENNARSVSYDNSVGQSTWSRTASKLQQLGPIPTGTGGSKLYFDMLTIYEEAEKLKEIFIDRMHDFLRSRMMGMAMTNSDPSQQLDLKLGHVR